MCFMGITSVDPVAGMTEANRKETSIKKAIIAASNVVVSMVISNKLNTRQPFRVGNIEDINIMVTELEPDAGILAPYKDRGVRVL